MTSAPNAAPAALFGPKNPQTAKIKAPFRQQKTPITSSLPELTISNAVSSQADIEEAPEDTRSKCRPCRTPPPRGGPFGGPDVKEGGSGDTRMALGLGFFFR